MNWWTSIVFYLWRNSLRRWIEQPLGLLSKLAVAALIGGLGSVVMAGMSFIGDEINERLMSRDAMRVTIREQITISQVELLLGSAQVEDEGWQSLSNDCLVLYQVPMIADLEGRRKIPSYALVDPESHGFPDSLVVISPKLPQGMMATLTLGDSRAEALVLHSADEVMQNLVGDDEYVIGSVERFMPLLYRGYTKRVMMSADSLESIQRAETIVKLMAASEGRSIQIWSSLPLLLKLQEVREMQRVMTIFIAFGSALVLGLTFGALAWMEFREERYLLSLVRSFGVGRPLLFGHSTLENCLVALTGTAIGLFGLSGLMSICSDGGPIDLSWLNAGRILNAGNMGVLLLGALLGGLLSCIPVAVGLRRPLGLTLK